MIVKVIFNVADESQSFSVLKLNVKEYYFLYCWVEIFLFRKVVVVMDSSPLPGHSKNNYKCIEIHGYHFLSWALIRRA